jgi:hypothetical protein
VDRPRRSIWGFPDKIFARKGFRVPDRSQESARLHAHDQDIPEMMCQEWSGYRAAAKPTGEFSCTNRLRRKRFLRVSRMSSGISPLSSWPAASVYSGRKTRKFSSVTTNGCRDELIADTPSLSLAGNLTVRGGNARQSAPSILMKPLI